MKYCFLQMKEPKIMHSGYYLKNSHRQVAFTLYYFKSSLNCNIAEFIFSLIQNYWEFRKKYLHVKQFFKL